MNWKKLLFWRRTNHDQAPVYARNFMIFAVNADRCWEIACYARNISNVPSQVRTCEAAFAMGAIARSIICEYSPKKLSDIATQSADEAFFETFDNQSDTPLPVEMTNYYGNRTLGQIARAAFIEYNKASSHPNSTLEIAHLFARRTKDDPRAAYEIKPIFDTEIAAIRKAYVRAFN